MKEVFNPANGVPLDAADLIGAVSMIFWGADGGGHAEVRAC